ncbi:hypothetical protein BaRGS_00027547 [Batillaria attramentaria]|uniref:C2H2-type domain-containing protein n=1 Tax=Batillaria attramentaria TaxID=370345 RepID=A0ABD0K2I5_9CAEN
MTSQGSLSIYDVPHAWVGMTSHMGQPADPSKPYSCPKCGVCYAQYSSLWRHRRKCEGTFELTCTFCEQKFHRKDQFREHLLHKHKFIDEALGAPGYTLNQRK